MDKEFRRISELLGNLKVETDGNWTFTTGSLGESEIVLHKCGIGKVNAAIGASELMRRYSPQLIISTGCAGGGQTSMEVKDVVVSTELTYHDVYCGEAMGKTVYGQVQGMPARFKSPAELVEKAMSLNGEVTARIHSGLFVTGDWFVDSREKMRSIVSLFPEAVAVDMESAAIAQTCHVFGVDSPEEAIQAIHHFYQEVGIPMTLREVGIDGSRIDEMAHHVAVNEGLDQAWVPLHEEDIAAILRNCL